MERAKRKTSNLHAYDYRLRSMAAFYRFTKEGSDEALALARKAVAMNSKRSEGQALCSRLMSALAKVDQLM